MMHVNSAKEIMVEDTKDDRNRTNVKICKWPRRWHDIREYKQSNEHKLKWKVGILINQMIYDVMKIKMRKEERGKRKRRYIVLCFEFGAQPDKWWDYAR